MASNNYLSSQGLICPVCEEDMTITAINALSPSATQIECACECDVKVIIRIPLEKDEESNIQKMIDAALTDNVSNYGDPKVIITGYDTTKEWEPFSEPKRTFFEFQESETPSNGKSEISSWVPGMYIVGLLALVFGEPIIALIAFVLGMGHLYYSGKRR